MKKPFRNPRRASCRLPIKQIGRTLVLAGLLGACAPTVELRGHITDEESVNALKAGVDNRESVSETLGTPSAIATFDTDVWFYISTRQERFAFFDPKILERNILAIEFDEKGNMGGVRRYSAVNGRVVEIVGRETPTKGKDLTFLEQMFGNFGRFSGTGTDTGPGGGGDR